jgi:hypothetical protein
VEAAFMQLLAQSFGGNSYFGSYSALQVTIHLAIWGLSEPADGAISVVSITSLTSCFTSKLELFLKIYRWLLMML